MKTPKVSVVIPVYNCAPYIEQTLWAILNQKYRNLEIIVVNDGSTDHLLEVLDKFLRKYKNIKYIFQENEGAAVARNKGILNATGKYIAFCDCDDVWLPNRLFKEVSFLEKNPHIGMCSGLAVPCTSELKPIPQTWFVDYGIVNYKLFLLNQIWTSSVVLRRNLLLEKKLFFDKRFKRAQDYHFWLRLSLVTPIFVLKKVSYFYRIRPKSITRDPSKRDKDYSNLAVHDVFGFEDIDFRSILFASSYKAKSKKYIEKQLKAIRDILNKYKELDFLSGCRQKIENYWIYLLYIFKYQYKTSDDVIKVFEKNSLKILFLGFYQSLLHKLHCKTQKIYLKIVPYFLGSYANKKFRAN